MTQQELAAMELSRGQVIGAKAAAEQIEKAILGGIQGQDLIWLVRQIQKHGVVTVNES